jgi:hypothetical protein
MEPLQCRCGNTLFGVVAEFDKATATVVEETPTALMCIVCHTLHEFNSDTREWALFAWNGNQWATVE